MKSQQNTQNSVYKALRKSILSLNLIPGKAISEKEISLLYSVSRTPVREAFIQLAKESLVQVIPQKETLVSLIDLKRMEQEHFLRKSLEMSSLEVFIEKAKAPQYELLEHYIDLQSQLTNGKDYVQFVSYDDNFHQIFFDTAGQHLSWEITENFCGHYFRVRLLSVWLNGIAESIVNQHKQLFTSLKNKDLNKSKQILEEHLQQLNNEKELLLQQFPFYFLKEKEDIFNVDFGGLQLN